MKKRKEGHSSNQTMTSFSFAVLIKASATQLHCKGMLTKEIKAKLSLSKVMSSKIQATSRAQNSIRLQYVYQLSKISFHRHIFPINRWSFRI